MADPGTELGALSAGDLGRTVRLVHEGVLIVGRLSRIGHESPIHKDGQPRTLISVVNDDGWRWHKGLDSSRWIVFPPTPDDETGA